MIQKCNISKLSKYAYGLINRNALQQIQTYSLLKKSKHLTALIILDNKLNQPTAQRISGFQVPTY
jgi:hypothetical protein